MKKLMVLFVAISFFAGVMLVGCGPKTEAPAPAKEEAQPAAPAAPAPEAAPAAPAAPAPEAPPAAPPAAK
jgi:hypothetical protein